MTSFNIGDLVVDNGGFPSSNSGLVGRVVRHETPFVIVRFDGRDWFYFAPELLPYTPQAAPTVTFEGKEYPVTTITRPKSVDLDETEFAFDTPYRRIRKDTYGHYVRSHGQRVAVTLKGAV